MQDPTRENKKVNSKCLEFHKHQISISVFQLLLRFSEQQKNLAMKVYIHPVRNGLALLKKMAFVLAQASLVYLKTFIQQKNNCTRDKSI